MKQNIGFGQFCDAFNASDTYKNNFSYAGKRALFDYLEQYEQDAGEEIELDIVALCCDYSEYSSAAEAVEQYEEGFLPDLGGREDCDLVEIAEATETQALAYLEERTSVIKFDKGIIIQQF